MKLLLMLDPEKGDIHMDIPGVSRTHAAAIAPRPSPPRARVPPTWKPAPSLAALTRRLRRPLQRQEEENVPSDCVRPVQPFDASWTPTPGEVSTPPLATPSPNPSRWE